MRASGRSSSYRRRRSCGPSTSVCSPPTASTSRRRRRCRRISSAKGLADGTWDIGIARRRQRHRLERRAPREPADHRPARALDRHGVLRPAAATASLADAAAEPDRRRLDDQRVRARALSRARSAPASTGGRAASTRSAACASATKRSGRQAAATILVPPFIDMALEAGFTRAVVRRGDRPGVSRRRGGRARRLARRERRRRARATCARCSKRMRGPRTRRTRDAAVAALVAARYSEGAAQAARARRRARARTRARGWDEVVALRRECGLLAQPEPRRGGGDRWQAACARERPKNNRRSVLTRPRPRRFTSSTAPSRLPRTCRRTSC